MDDERYKEEQEGEIEALNSIYADEITGMRVYYITLHSIISRE